MGLLQCSLQKLKPLLAVSSVVRCLIAVRFYNAIGPLLDARSQETFWFQLEEMLRLMTWVANGLMNLIHWNGIVLPDKGLGEYGGLSVSASELGSFIVYNDMAKNNVFKF